MTVHDRIEINPKIMLGKPVIRGTRIPLELNSLMDACSSNAVQAIRRPKTGVICFIRATVHPVCADRI